MSAHPKDHCSNQTDVALHGLDYVAQPACQYLLSETLCVTLCRVERDVRRQRKRVGVEVSGGLRFVLYGDFTYG
jgi:hypothetical protein